jgi:hypothetical protein
VSVVGNNTQVASTTNLSSPPPHPPSVQTTLEDERYVEVLVRGTMVQHRGEWVSVVGNNTQVASTTNLSSPLPSPPPPHPPTTFARQCRLYVHREEKVPHACSLSTNLSNQQTSSVFVLIEG